MDYKVINLTITNHPSETVYREFDIDSLQDGSLWSCPGKRLMYLSDRESQVEHFQVDGCLGLLSCMVRKYHRL